MNLKRYLKTYFHTGNNWFYYGGLDMFLPYCYITIRPQRFLQMLNKALSLFTRFVRAESAIPNTYSANNIFNELSYVHGAK